jgi:CubicO group peptidase (beta-lactamase class C family)
MTVSDLQRQVEDAADRLISSGAEVGLQVAVMHRGQLVVNVAAGAANPVSRVPVRPDTLFWAASAAKGVASTVAHVLAERGELDYDVQVAEAWPEFAAHGKDKVTVRHVLCHTAGVPGLPPDLTAAQLCDWDEMCNLLANAEPWWEAGTRFGYHEYTFGFLLGETLRRITGQTISELLHELITNPLGVEDQVHFGVPERLLPRAAHQVASLGAVPPPPDPDSPQARARPEVIGPTAELANRGDVLCADIPSIGTMTAEGVATIYSALLGQIDGIKLVSPERLEAMAALTYSGVDEIMGVPSQWAFGYSPYRPAAAAARPGSTFGMVGGNGSAAFADIDSGVAVAVMRNYFTLGDFQLAEHIDTLISQSLGGPDHA